MNVENSFTAKILWRDKYLRVNRLTKAKRNKSNKASLQYTYSILIR